MRHGFLDGLQILGAGMEKKMDVSVDEARHQRRVAEVDFFRALGMVHSCPGLDDALAANEDLPGCKNASALDVKQPCRMQQNRAGGLGSCD